jgi:hypothetical protein
VLPQPKNLRGKSIVRGGADTASRAVGPLGDLLTYSAENGMIDNNPAHGIRKGSPLDGDTAHVLRHNFASLANDLGYTEITIAALIGHSKGALTSKHVHTLDTSLVMAADTIADYMQGLLGGEEFRHATYMLDRASRKAVLARFLAQAKHGKADPNREQIAA